jgi:hypothetical protein
MTHFLLWFGVGFVAMEILKWFWRAVTLWLDMRDCARMERKRMRLEAALMCMALTPLIIKLLRDRRKQ